MHERHRGARCAFCDRAGPAAGPLLVAARAAICRSCAEHALRQFRERTALDEDEPCSFCRRKRGDVHLLQLGKAGATICYDCGLAFGDEIREMERGVDELFARPETDEEYAQRRGPPA